MRGSGSFSPQRPGGWVWGLCLIALAALAGCATAAHEPADHTEVDPARPWYERLRPEAYEIERDLGVGESAPKRPANGE
jgi:hypothetical protein